MSDSQTPQEILDAHTRDIVAWHFSPETGCPFWLRWAAENWDPREEVRCYRGSDEVPPLQGRVAARRAERALSFPKAFEGRPFNVFETGGTTGLPKQRIGWDDYKHDYEKFSETLERREFSRAAANWIMVGPTGPRRLRLAIEHLANIRGGSCYFVDLDPRWVKKLIVRKADRRGGALPEARRRPGGGDHQAPEHSAACSRRRSCSNRSRERISIPGRGIKGVFCGGTTMTPADGALPGGGGAGGEDRIRSDLREHADGTGLQHAAATRTATASPTTRRSRARCCGWSIRRTRSGRWTTANTGGSS